jgi:hypothetical protein
MFSDEMAEDAQFWSEAEDEVSLRLPGLHTFTA